MYFVVIDYGLELLNTKEQVINDASEATPPINLVVDRLNEKTRNLINETPVEGWVGGFGTSNPSTFTNVGKYGQYRSIGSPTESSMA